jgi:hypothetical protein
LFAANHFSKPTVLELCSKVQTLDKHLTTFLYGRSLTFYLLCRSEHPGLQTKTKKIAIFWNVEAPLGRFQDAITWTSKIPLGTSFAIWLQQLFGLDMFFPFLLNILRDTFCHSHQARQSNA